MRILLMDKNLIDRGNYPKWEAFARLKGIDLEARCPEQWIENSRMLDFPDQQGVSFTCLSLPVVWTGFENRGFYTSGLKKAFLKADPDVLICFEEPCSLFALQALLLVQRLKPSCKLVYYSWYNRYPDRFYAYRPQTFYRSILHFTLRRADLVLCANEAGLTYYRSQVGERAKKLYFSVDLERFKASVEKEKGVRAGAVKEKPFKIGYIGRLLTMKGVDLLIDAFAKSRFHREWSLTILGSGPERDALQARIEQKGVADRATLLEGIPSSEVGAHLRSLDVLVLPSRSTRFWVEQFGRVIAEAMSAGVVVIGSNSGSIAEVIDDAGLVFPEEDASALRDRLEELYNDPGKMQELRKRGFERVKLFSPDHFAKTLHDYLDAMMSGSSEGEVGSGARDVAKKATPPKGARVSQSQKGS